MPTETTPNQNETASKPFVADCYVCRFNGHETVFTKARFLRSTKTTVTVVTEHGTEKTFNGTRAQADFNGKSYDAIPERGSSKSYRPNFLTFAVEYVGMLVQEANKRNELQRRAADAIRAFNEFIQGRRNGYGHILLDEVQVAALEQGVKIATGNA